MIIRSYPKVNICFKITGFLGNYCEIASRFALVKSANLYDTIEIRQSDSFKISGNFDCKMSENTIFKAKEALREFLESRGRNSSLGAPCGDFENLGRFADAPVQSHAPNSQKTPQFPPQSAGFANEVKQPILEFDSSKSDSSESNESSLRDSAQRAESWQYTIKSLDNFNIEVDKQIPSFSGLGGGSSNAASYLMAMNEILELNLMPKDLVQIARRVGADVSFFVCGFNSANVFGIGEGVEFFNEKVPELEFFTPPIQCSTKAVYDEYRAMNARGEAHFYKNARELLANDSATLLQKNTINFLNDLYAPACKIYPQLKDFAKDGYFFSGSGSSFFRLKI